MRIQEPDPLLERLHRFHPRRAPRPVIQPVHRKRPDPVSFAPINHLSGSGTGYLGNMLQPTDAEMTANGIMQDVARKHHVTIAELKGPCRQRHIVRARQEYMARVRAAQGWSLPVIGRTVNRDHTSVLYGIKAHEKRMGEAQ